MDFKQFKRDRHEALLSMDRDKIHTYCLKYKVVLPADERVFWIAIHKARTACASLPEDERMKSKEWLERRGYKAWD